MRFITTSVGVIILVTALVLIRFAQLPTPIKERYAHEFNRRYYTISYGNIPIDTAAIVKTVVFSGFFGIEKTLEKSETRRLLEILSDPANYQHGEIEIPDLDKTLFYYDEKGGIIGETILRNGGQVSTLPFSESRTESNHLNGPALESIIELTN
jgi:hypothetical protein